MGLPEHTSASQLTTYASCPRKYALRYLEGAAAEDRGPSLVIGSVVHSAVAWFYDAQIAGEQPTVQDALDIGRADFAAQLHGPPIRLGQWTRDDLRAHALRLAAFFLGRHSELPVVATEERISLEVVHPTTGEVLGRPLLGYLDLRLENRKVIELKTARSRYQPTDLASNLQFGAYAASLDALQLETLDVWVILKNRSPDLQKLRVSKSIERLTWFFEAAQEIEAAIDAGHFPPSPGWTCATCEYRTRCLGSAVSPVSQAA